jgi:hypothetical protein
VTTTIKKLWKNEYFQTAVFVILMVTLVFGFWYGSQIALKTSIFPALPVISGSMDTISAGQNPGWVQPFDRTLQVGDFIIIQGVNPKDLNTNYPNSDIIVFHRPDDPSELVVHRITSEIVKNGTIYFFTKGDGNPPAIWPSPAEPNQIDYGWYNNGYDTTAWYRNHPEVPNGSVSEDLVVGKVVMRIPVLGYLPMIVQGFIGNNTLLVIPVIVFLIILLILIEFAVPMLRHKQQRVEQGTSLEQTQIYPREKVQ